MMMVVMKPVHVHVYLFTVPYTVFECRKEVEVDYIIVIMNILTTTSYERFPQMLTRKQALLFRRSQIYFYDEAKFLLF